MNATTICVIVLALIGHLHAWSPDDDKIYRPCYRDYRNEKPDEYYNAIYCSKSYKTFNIRQYFQRLSRELDAKDKHFTSLYISDNEMIDELPPNAFADIQFDSITFSVSSLTRVHGQAFNGTHLSVKKLSFIDTPVIYSTMNAEYNVFRAINTLKALETLELSNTKLTEIPDNAIIPSLPKLTTLNIRSGRILSIGRLAFTGVKTLKDSPVCDDNDDIFTIDLTGNELHKAQIEQGVFDGFQRPVHLKLRDNGIDFLNETLFEGFMSEHKFHTIFSDTDCMDSRNDWLREKYPFQWVDTNC